MAHPDARAGSSLHVLGQRQAPHVSAEMALMFASSASPAEVSLPVMLAACTRAPGSRRIWPKRKPLAGHIWADGRGAIRIVSALAQCLIVQAQSDRLPGVGPDAEALSLGASKADFASLHGETRSAGIATPAP